MFEISPDLVKSKVDRILNNIKSTANLLTNQEEAEWNDNKYGIKWRENAMKSIGLIIDKEDPYASDRIRCARPIWSDYDDEDDD